MNGQSTTLWRIVAGAGLGACLFFGCTGDSVKRAFEQGIREYERGRNVRAITLLEKALNLRPGGPEATAAYYYIGLAARRLGRIERAIEAFEASRRLDPDAYEPAYALAVIFFEGGDAERAQPLFEACAQRRADDPRPLEFLAQLHLRAGRVALARHTLLNALTRAPASPRILTSLALVEVAAGDVSKAAFYLEQALQRDPNYAPALYNLGMLQRGPLGDRAAAEKILQRFVAVETNEARRLEAQAAIATLKEPVATAPPAVQAAPRVEKSHSVTGGESVEERGPVVTGAPGMPKRSELEERLKEAQALASRGKPDEAVKLCLALAGEARRAGDPIAEEKALRQAMKVGFDRSEVHVAWGRFLGRRGDWTNAMGSFKQAVALQRDDVEAHRQLAEAALRLGEYDTALVALRQVTQLQPDAADAWWEQAVLYDEKINVSARALEMYREFVGRFPGDPRVVRAQKRLQELEPTAPGAAVGPPAEKPQQTPPPSTVSTTGEVMAPALPRVVASQPSGEVRLNIRHPRVRNPQAAVQAYNRGTLYQQHGDWDQAIFYYTRALENDDTFVTAYFNLGSVYWTRGDHALAKAAYRRAIELEPQAPAVRYNLALLHYELREWDAAMRELKTLIETAPDYAQAHYLLGLLYAQDPKQIELAKTHYRKFLELAPNDPLAPAVQRWLSQQGL